MQKTFIYLILVLFFYACNDNLDELNVLPPNNTWTKNLTLYRYDTSGSFLTVNEIVKSKYAIESTFDNGFVIPMNGNLKKYNASAQLLWEKNFLGTIQRVQALTNNEYLLAGLKNDENWIAKTDENWNILWEQSLAYAGALTSIAETTDGLILAITDAADSWVLKYDDNGNFLWEQKFERSGMENIQAVDISPDGNVIAVGSASVVEIEGSKGGSDIWLINMDKDGNIVWEKAYGTTQKDEGYGIRVTEDGFIILGKKDIKDDSNSSIFRLNKDGKLKSEHSHGYSIFNTLDEMQSGDFMLVGKYTEGVDYGESEFALSFAKMNEDGERVWQSDFGYNSYSREHEPIAICQLTDGSYIFFTVNEDYDFGSFILYKME